MGEIITIPTSSRRRPVPEQGLYGPGLQHEADVELFALGVADRNPGYDKEGTFAPYLEFTFRISPADGPNHFVREVQSMAPDSGSKAILWLDTCEVPYEIITGEDGTEQIAFDKSVAAPRKIAGIEMGSPREWTGDDGAKRTNHGRVVRLVGRG